MHLFAWSLVLAALLFAGNLFGQTNFPVRIMAANITSGNFQSYEAPGIRIFQGLKPDIVAIQEFQVAGGSSSNDLRTLVDTAFGSEFSFYCEPNTGIPNGIVSRWPILAAGVWDDPFLTDRDFAWARINIPGTNDLYVVSVHLHGSGGPVNRGIEGNIIKDQIQTNFPANAWVVVGGDFNADVRTEDCVENLKTILSDNPIPTDLTSAGNPNTNEPRNKPYDYVMPSFSLANFQVPVVIGAQTFSNGLVFDSLSYNNIYTLAAVSPIQAGDSHVSGMQHMAVLKDFLISTNSTPPPSPPSITDSPQSQTNYVGSSVIFTVSATGTVPLAYQWRFNGTDINGATGTSYSRVGIQMNDAGSYVAVVTNSTGSVTSAVATLTVLPNQIGGPLLAAWDVSGQTNFGTALFPATTNHPNVAVSAMTRGPGVTTVPTAANRAWGGNGFTATSAAEAITNGDYVTFSITAVAPYRLSFTGISKFDYRRSGSGPPSGLLQCQVDVATPFIDVASLLIRYRRVAVRQ
jgi:endonuclease/exonuclease/phosphatase family metal-dependent hydrolase